METMPKNILDQFNAVLRQQNVPVVAHNHFRKWLLHFLGFRVKHSPPDSRSEQVKLFMEKLRLKNKTAVQQEQAAFAVLNYFFKNRSTSSAHTSSRLLP